MNTKTFKVSFLLTQLFHEILAANEDDIYFIDDPEKIAHELILDFYGLTSLESVIMDLKECHDEDTYMRTLEYVTFLRNSVAKVLAPWPYDRYRLHDVVVIGMRVFIKLGKRHENRPNPTTY